MTGSVDHVLSTMVQLSGSLAWEQRDLTRSVARCLYLYALWLPGHDGRHLFQRPHYAGMRPSRLLGMGDFMRHSSSTQLAA